MAVMPIDASRLDDPSPTLQESIDRVLGRGGFATKGMIDTVLEAAGLGHCRLDPIPLDVLRYIARGIEARRAWTAEREALCVAVSAPKDASRSVLMQAVAGYRSAFNRADENSAGFWRQLVEAEGDRDVLAVGLQALDKLSEWAGADPLRLEAVPNSNGGWLINVATKAAEGESEVETLLELYDSDDPCLAAGLVAEDLTKRLAGQVNAAVDLAERLTPRGVQRAEKDGQVIAELQSLQAMLKGGSR
jgi:hypothetical protein